MWVEAHPDAIKNIWYEQGRKREDVDWEKEINIRIMVVAPSFGSSVPRLLNKVGYRIDLVEFKMRARNLTFQKLRHLCRFEKGGYCKKTRRRCESQNCPQILKEE